MPHFELDPGKMEADIGAEDLDVGNINLLNGPRENDYFNFILSQLRRKQQFNPARYYDHTFSFINCSRRFSNYGIVPMVRMFLVSRSHLLPLPLYGVPGEEFRENVGWILGSDSQESKKCKFVITLITALNKLYSTI